ncbi:MAG TPA: threonine ammonia-lyase [Burkholderiales bacterium]|jgi:threonine dehydratase
MSVALEDAVAARARIAGSIYESPCVESIPLSQQCGAHVYCKLDYLQRTGSFKERGARNALATLTPEQKARGAIAASAGNHALAMAYHGGLLGIPVTVVMPRFAPLIKVANCRKLAATVVLHGDNLAQARAHADALAQARGLTYIHGYDDAAIIAGQGTIALEVLEQVKEIDAIVVPVGGGGLIAGVARVVKSLQPEIKVIGVEPEHAACFSAALAAGEPVDVEVKPTLADGLAVARVGPRSFAVARELVDRMVTVSETELAVAIMRLIELEKSVVEGAGAAAFAALLAGKLPELAGKRVVVLLSGGNIDLNFMQRAIEVGLVQDARLTRFTVVISDRPGGLAGLAGLIAAAGASIKEIAHDRAFSGPDASAVRMVCTVETADAAHRDQMLATLCEKGLQPVVEGEPAR